MIPFSFSLEWVPGHLFKIASEIEWGDGEVGGGGGEERKRGEGFLFVWGRLLKRGCLSEQRPSTICLLHLFVSWANLSSVVQPCPLEILSLYILSPAYFGEGGRPLFCLSWGFQLKAFLVSIPGCSFTAWPVHLNFLRPICIWMGALPDISHGTSFVTVSVCLCYFQISSHVRIERCEGNYTGMNAWEIHEWMTKWSIKLMNEFKKEGWKEGG